jgi:hypothetical protein
MRMPADVKPWVLGGPNTAFLERYGLDKTSHLMDWFTAIMLLTLDANKEDPAIANVKVDRKTKFAVSNWTAYSNTKAMMCNAGEQGHIFAGKFKLFKNKDIIQMLGVYILDGIAPSPQLVWKMQPQMKQPTHVNNKIASTISPRYQQKHHSFRHFFGCQDPLMTPPPEDKCPNFKVDDFFRWLCYIWKEVWCLAKGFLINEQSCKMQGKSKHKTHCGKFKRLGDGIQTNAIANDGYMWDFYIRNEPIDQELLAMGFCPMHCRLITMFRNLVESGHHCTMDNLFNSVKLARAAYSIEKPVLVHGVLRKTGRGAPPMVFQEEKTGKAAVAARGTVKAAVLKGDSLLSDLDVASCFDQKPFYMISHNCKSIGRMPIMKKLWSSAMKQNVNHTFLLWSLSNQYNFEMNDNDIANQLCLVYRIMRFQRNNKWWWALFLWGYEVSIVSSYVCMKRYCKLKGVPVPWTHHDWNEAIGYAHLDLIKDWPRRKSSYEQPAKKQEDISSAAKKRAPQMDSLALSPMQGHLRFRLNETKKHMPITPLLPNAACQLHCWVYKETHPMDKIEGGNAKPSGLRSHVMQCKTFEVNLCVKCWKTYPEQHFLKPLVFDILGEDDIM